MKNRKLLEKRLARLRRAARADTKPGRKFKFEFVRPRTTIHLCPADMQALEALREYIPQKPLPTTSLVYRLALRHAQVALASERGREGLNQSYTQILSFDGRQRKA